MKKTMKSKPDSTNHIYINHLANFSFKIRGLLVVCNPPWVWPPHRMPVTTRIITFLVGDPYKPSFTTVTVRGPHPKSTNFLYIFRCAKFPGLSDVDNLI